MQLKIIRLESLLIIPDRELLADIMKDIQRSMIKWMDDNSSIGQTQIPSSTQETNQLYLNNQTSMMRLLPAPKKVLTSYSAHVSVKDNLKFFHVKLWFPRRFN